MKQEPERPAEQPLGYRSEPQGVSEGGGTGLTDEEQPEGGLSLPSLSLDVRGHVTTQVSHTLVPVVVEAVVPTMTSTSWHDHVAEGPPDALLDLAQRRSLLDALRELELSVPEPLIDERWVLDTLIGPAVRLSIAALELAEKGRGVWAGVRNRLVAAKELLLNAVAWVRQNSSHIAAWADWLARAVVVHSVIDSFLGLG